MDSCTYPNRSRLPLVFDNRMSTHNYSRYKEGIDYVFDAIDETKGYLTGHGSNLKVGDYLLITFAGQPCRCRIQQIDYYCAPSNMWIALVSLIN